MAISMKILSNPDLHSTEEIPVVSATPLPPRRKESSRAEIAPVRKPVPSGDAAAINFLRQFRVLLGAARLYQRNHPRLMEILASLEHQLRITLTLQSPLVFAIERNGIILPRYDATAGELLHDPRGELRGLAEELLRGGICSMLFAPPINVGELDSLAHEISQVPRSATPGDTASRKLWDAWIKEQRIAGIRLNVPTERRDSLLLASLVSAVLAYDEACAAVRGRSRHAGAACGQLRASRDDVARAGETGSAARSGNGSFRAGCGAAVSFCRVRQRTVRRFADRARSLPRRPREGETLEPYLERLADALVLAFVKQEFECRRRDASAGDAFIGPAGSGAHAKRASAAPPVLAARNTTKCAWLFSATNSGTLCRRA